MARFTRLLFVCPNVYFHKYMFLFSSNDNDNTKYPKIFTHHSNSTLGVSNDMCEGETLKEVTMYCFIGQRSRSKGFILTGKRKVWAGVVKSKWKVIGDNCDVKCWKRNLEEVVVAVWLDIEGRRQKAGCREKICKARKPNLNMTRREHECIQWTYSNKRSQDMS